MDWSPQSPGLNITECVWDYLNCEKQKMQTEKNELKANLPKRIEAVQKKFGYTKTMKKTNIIQIK